MKIRIHLPQIGRKASAETIRRAAIEAENLGFDDVWVSEHIIVPQDAPTRLRRISSLRISCNAGAEA